MSAKEEAGGSTYPGVDASRMRQSNLSLVLATIIREAPIAQATLAQITGLNKATVSSLVDELFGLGWIRQEGHFQGRTGRPRQLLVSDGNKGCIVGAEINVDYLAVLITDFSGKQRAFLRKYLDVGTLGVEEVIRVVKRLTLQAVRQADTDLNHILGVALGLPGVVTDEGSLLVAPKINWQSVKMRDLIQGALDTPFPLQIPVLVENEANLGALAEKNFGCCATVSDFVYISGEIGVGAGVFLSEQLFRGTHGGGGEVGHVTIDASGPRCECGKVGCWTKFVSQRALQDILHGHKAAGRKSQLWVSGTPGSGGSAITPERVLWAIHQGDAVARETLDEIQRYLAIGIGNLVSMYDPQVVVLGGFFATLFSERIERLKDEVDNWIMGDYGKELRIELAAKGQDSCVWGGIGLMRRQLIANPRLVRL